MVAQHTMRACDLKKIMFNGFVNIDNKTKLRKKPICSHTCATVSELPFDINTLVLSLFKLILVHGFNRGKHKETGVNSTEKSVTQSLTHSDTFLGKPQKQK